MKALRGVEIVTTALVLLIALALVASLIFYEYILVPHYPLHRIDSLSKLEALLDALKLCIDNVTLASQKCNINIDLGATYNVKCNGTLGLICISNTCVNVTRVFGWHMLCQADVNAQVLHVNIKLVDAIKKVYSLYLVAVR